ncbi:MAG TPA: NIL domain-containing protein [Verrucomicrobiae bacterium]|nr:NIL domain-containing protein [Verrucomicrobiae bacterium]
MPKTRKPKKTSRSTRSGDAQQRLWLMYPPRLIQKALVWEIGSRFGLVTNIRQASVTDEIGIVCLELDGKQADIDASIRWLEKLGVKVEPVEISIVES